jgi:hypothetical protein
MNARNETEEKLLRERARRSYVKGMLCAIVREGVDLDAAARELDELLMSGQDRFNEMEKIILGEIKQIVEEDLPAAQLVAVACKIRDFYHNRMRSKGGHLWV